MFNAGIFSESVHEQKRESERLQASTIKKKMSATHGRRAASSSKNNNPDERRILSGEDLEKMKERLCRPRKIPKPTDGDLLAPKKSISQDDLGKQISRLYEQSIETKKRKMEKARKSEEQGLPESKKMTEEEINDSVVRQYTQALTAKHNTEAKLKKKYLFAPGSDMMKEAGSVSARMTPRTGAEIKAMGARLHDESRQKKEESMEKLRQKYVYSTGPQKKTISVAEAEEAAERLSTPRWGAAALPPQTLHQSARSPRK